MKPEKKTVSCAGCARRRENIKIATVKVWRTIKGLKRK